MLPGSLVTLFGSVSGIIAIILAVGILVLFFLFLITLIISCILIKKKKLLADAWMKLIIFLIFTCISALFIQVGEITVLMIIPVILAGIVLIKLYVHKKPLIWLYSCLGWNEFTKKAGINKLLQVHCHFTDGWQCTFLLFLVTERGSKSNSCRSPNIWYQK